MLKLDKKFDKSNVTRNLAAGGILVPYLDRAFETFDEPFEFKYEPKVKDDGWHPSGDCLPLASALYDTATEAVTSAPPSGSLRKSFMVGHYWHQLLQYIVVHKLELCTAEAVERHIEKKWAPDDDSPPFGGPYCYVSGSADIAPLEMSRWRGIVDFKTMRSGDFIYQSLPTWAAAKYICQMNIYMDLFLEDQALIVAINKDSPHDFKEFTFVRNQDLIDAIYAKWQFVSACIETKHRPTEHEDTVLQEPFRMEV